MWCYVALCTVRRVGSRRHHRRRPSSLGTPEKGFRRKFTFPSPRLGCWIACVSYRPHKSNLGKRKRCRSCIRCCADTLVHWLAPDAWVATVTISEEMHAMHAPLLPATSATQLMFKVRNLLTLISWQDHQRYEAPRVSPMISED